MTWEWRRHDKATVLECLKEGRYEAITTSAQGPLDALAHVAIEMGVFDAVQELEVEREREGIPDILLLRTLTVLPFIEADSFREATGSLFADVSILLQLGYTAVQIREGFNHRYRNSQGVKSVESFPCHPESLREEMKRIKPASLGAFRRRCIGDLFQRRLVRDRVYAIDGTGLGKEWLLVVLLNVSRERTLLVNWRLLAGTASEKGSIEASVVLDMIREVLEIGSPEAISWLIMDALYADGPLLATLKYRYQIDSLVRVPENRDIYKDMEQLVSLEKARWQTHPDVRYVAGHKQSRQVSVAAVEDLTTWDSFLATAKELGGQEPKLWGCLIHDRLADSQEESENWALVGTAPFSTGWQGYTFWRLRWRVENNGFRELKEGWKLEKARWGRSQPLVSTRVTMSCVAFNVAQVAKGKDGQRLLHLGIRRLRRELGREYGVAPVIVYAGHCYGIFHIEEIMSALGHPPAESLRPVLRSSDSPPHQTGPPASHPCYFP